ncbi:hypothetical protein Tco_0099789 [Tanacetum coccineum]
MKFLFTTFKVYYVLEEQQIGILTKEEQRKRDQDETLCRGNILSTLTDRLYDMYTPMTSIREIRNSLQEKYTAEKEGADKFITFKFFEFTMEDNVSILDQLHKFNILVSKFKNLNIEIPGKLLMKDMNEVDTILGIKVKRHIEGFSDTSWITGSNDSKFTTVAGKKAEWLRNMLLDIELWPQPMPAISLHCDSQSTLSRAYNKSPTCVNFLRWYDPPMCQRSVQIIRGLLRSRNELKEILAMVEEKRRKLLDISHPSPGLVFGTQMEAQQANELSNLTRQRQLLASVNYRRAIIQELERLPGNLVACKTREHLKCIQKAVFVEVIELKKELRLQVPP